MIIIVSMNFEKKINKISLYVSFIDPYMLLYEINNKF